VAAPVWYVAQAAAADLYPAVPGRCHQPGGSAHIDMSTYSGWAQLRAQVAQRVVAMQPSPMPPAGSGKLTTEELAIVAAWAARTPNQVPTAGVR
jgi:hypothetical protein